MQSSKEKSEVPSRRGRPRDPERLRRVLETAVCHFQSQGFERTSIDAIARDSGVSKVTIYSYFPSKEALYGAAISTRADADVGPELFSGLDPLRPKPSLTKVGRQFLKLMRADEVIGKHRTLFSQNPVQTPLAEQYFRNGPVLTVERLEQYLLACVKAGTLKCRDAELAANQFFSLFLGLGHIQCLLGLEKPSEAADERLLKANVDLFLKALQPTAPKIGDGSD